MFVMCKPPYSLYLRIKIRVCQGEIEENAAYQYCVHVVDATG
jgi:hypothetical protein